MKRIGIFGGTFNPPHVGHLIVAEHICERLKLDKLFFIPSYISPHKKRGEQRLAFHRLRMVRIAIKADQHFAFSDIELKRKGTSYTYKTVEAFHEKFSGCKLFLIIGADNFNGFHEWKNPERIIELASLIVMNRPSYTLTSEKKKKYKGVRFIPVPDIQISSTEIRSLVRQHKSIRYLVPQGISEYIHRHRLYR